MASDSFARGGQPRSVPDPDGAAYDATIKRHRQTVMRREGTRQPAASDAPSSDPAAHPRHGPVEAIASSIVHILDAPRKARHEIEQGHIIRGVVDGATAAADLELGRSAVSGIGRGSFKLSGSHSWKKTREWLGEKGLAEKGQHVHHALIPNNRWGRAIPDLIKNQPWNLKAMETPLHHIRTHARSLQFGLPRFSALERYWHSTPTWWKAADGSALGHVAEIISDHVPGHAQAPQAHNPPHKR